MRQLGLKFVNGIFLLICLLPNAYATQPNSISSEALIIIGGSYASGVTRIDDNQNAFLNGWAVGSGEYLSLGDALVREQRLNGLVVNEADVGSSTIDRYPCALDECLPYGKTLGYESQFQNALRRTIILGTENEYNAKYLVIGVPNDCIHSDSFGIPQSYAQPCFIDEINDLADNIIKVAKDAEALGITPIIPLMPKYKHLDLALVQQGLGFLWVANEEQYNLLRFNLSYRLKNELSNALIVDIWAGFEHRGDGIHPNRATVEKAAKRIAKRIKRHEREQRNKKRHSY